MKSNTIVGEGRGAGLNYYVNPSFKTIKYKNINSVNISPVNYFEKRIIIVKNDGSQTTIPFLYKSEKELEEIIIEIKKRLV